MFDPVNSAFFLSHKMQKNMKKEEGNILLHIPPFFGRKNLSNFEKEKDFLIFFLGLHFQLDYFRGKGG